MAKKMGNFQFICSIIKSDTKDHIRKTIAKGMEPFTIMMVRLLTKER